MSTHPQPQLRRRGWQELDGTWDFAYDDDDRGTSERWWSAFPEAMSITVPYPPESSASGIGDRGFHPVVWYRHRLSGAAPLPGERVLLHVGACDYEATVWCNGHVVGTHRGGHTPFTCDLTDVLDGPEADIVIRAHDDPTSLTQPRGKQAWSAEPDRIWYPRTTGLWQPVWLERVPDRHIASITWSSELDEGRIDCSVKLTGRPRPDLRLHVELALDGRPFGSVVVPADEDAIECSILPPALRSGVDRNRYAWSPERPVLVDATVRLVDRSDQALDEIDSYLGLRELALRDGQFLLNGRPYFLQLVLEQGIWPDTHLAAPDDDALRREVELVKALGFNGVRVHQKFEDPRFLYWCDRLGLLVWEELPSAYAFNSESIERLTAEWVEIIRRDRSHPCIVAWVPFNESWGVPDLPSRRDQQSFVRALTSLTRALDPSRPVISNDGWEHLDSDLWTIHDYASDPDTLTERYSSPDALVRVFEGRWPGPRRILLDDQGPSRPVLVTEFGGISIAPEGGAAWFGYATVDSQEGYCAKVTALIAAMRSSSAIAGFCYTQLTDTFQETNGLLTAAREPKLPLAALRAALGVGEDAPGTSPQALQAAQGADVPGSAPSISDGTATHPIVQQPTTTQTGGDL